MSNVAALPLRWERALARHRAGELSAPVALAQLLLAGEEANVAEALAGRPGCEEIVALARANAGRLDVLRELVADLGGADASVEGTRALFDHLAARAPEAGVAIYSLGDPALLDAATAELVEVIERWAGLAGRDLFDFGCGIGRVSVAAASRARSVLGLDLSPGMLAEARRRATGLADVRFVLGDGRGLEPVPDASVDVAIAADSVPFLVSAGDDLLDRHFGEFARSLRPGGDLLVFNWSYRGNPAADIADARRLAAAHGFAVLRAGEAPFRLWDGVGFHLRRA